MRKSRTVIEDFDPDIYDSITADIDTVSSHFDSLGILLPEWANMMLVFVKKNKIKLDISVFEVAEDFFFWYSRVVLVCDDMIVFACYSKEKDNWRRFNAPTLIGTNLITRLRES